METSTNTKKLQGFAALTPERRSEIASMGGKESQRRGTAYRWTSEKAQEAGRKGGQSTKLKALLRFKEEL